MEQLADTLSTQLENLRRERERFEHLLMLDANWRALKQLEAREAAGDPVVAVDGAGLKASLEAALASNRIFAARARLSESIDLLAGAAEPEPTPLANRIVLLDGSSADGFRTRLRLKEKPTGVVAAPVPALEPEPVEPEPVKAEAIEPETVQPEPVSVLPVSVLVVGKPAVLPPPDALELIDGLSRATVEQLLEGGIANYADIARWSAADVALWRLRLGAAEGEIGGWIEQAAMLADGRRTRYSGMARRGDFSVLVLPPQPLPEPVPISRPLALPTAQVSTSQTSVSDVCEPVVEPHRDTDDTVEPLAAVVDSAPSQLAFDTSAIGMPAAKIDPPLAGDAASLPSRLLSAEELIRTLAAAGESPPPSSPAPTQSALAHVARRPYVRPESRRTERAEASRYDTDDAASIGRDSEVIVARRDPEKAPSPGFAQAGRPRPQRLLRRLKQALEPDRFEAEGYAAYRGVAEEASVTIVRAEPQRSRPEGPTVDPVLQPGARSRFLKALTGHRQ